MKPELVEKANELLEEIKDLKRYKDLITDRNHGQVAHFEFVQHYGQLKDYDMVQIDKKHNNVFITVLDTIINKLEKELEEL